MLTQRCAALALGPRTAAAAAAAAATAAAAARRAKSATPRTDDATMQTTKPHLIYPERLDPGAKAAAETHSSPETLSQAARDLLARPLDDPELHEFAPVWNATVAGAGKTGGLDDAPEMPPAAGEGGDDVRAAFAPASPPVTIVETTDFGRGTYMSRLSNGLRVITQEKGGVAGTPSAAVALYTNFGFCVEDQSSRGCSHAFERMAFGATARVDHATVVRMMEEDAVTPRSDLASDVTGFTIELFPEQVPKYLDVLASVTLDPCMTPEYLDSLKEYMELDVALKATEYDTNAIRVMEEVAYGGVGLGNPWITPVDAIQVLDVDSLTAFRNKHLVTDNMVLSAVGVPHADFVTAAAASFADAKPRDPAAPGLSPLPAPGTDVPYTGGLRVDAADIRAVPYQHSNVVIGFEGEAWNGPQFVTLAVLQMLLGGGFAFSAGGPGKGMYTRLYQTLLAQYEWLNSANAHNVIHANSGVFAIHASAAHEFITDALVSLIGEIAQIGSARPTDEAVSRARNMLKSMVAMNLERRAVLAEDMARQVLLSSSSTYQTPDILYGKIDSVTSHDLHKKFRALVDSPPTLYVSTIPEMAGYIPDLDKINEAFSVIRSRWV